MWPVCGVIEAGLHAGGTVEGVAPAPLRWPGLCAGAFQFPGIERAAVRMNNERVWQASRAALRFTGVVIEMACVDTELLDPVLQIFFGGRSREGHGDRAAHEGIARLGQRLR